MTNDANTPDSADSFDGELPEAVIFDILSNKRRRECIVQILGHPAASDIDAKAVADAVADELCDDEAPSQQCRRSVYISLTQTHFPMLAEHDVIEYDRSDKTLSKASNVHVVGNFLDVPSSQPRPGDVVSSQESVGAVGERGYASSIRDAFPVGFTRGVRILASFGVVVVLLVAVLQPLLVPDVLRVAFALLHAVLLGTYVGVDFESVVTWTVD